MNTNRGISLKLCGLLMAGLLACGTAAAQGSGQADKDDDTKTKQAQAVSKEVYERIQKGQELVDAKDYNGALRLLESLYNPDKLTEYEQANVLNYIGFIHYNMDNMPAVIRTYEKLLTIPSLEPQMAKQVTFTLAQLQMVEENYPRALTLLDKWFTLEPNPAPEPYVLRAQILYNLNRFAEMVKPIETAMDVARSRNLPVKEDWWGLLNFAYFQQENYVKVRDIQKILLET